MTYITVWDSQRAESKKKLKEVSRLEKLRCRLMTRLIQVHRQLEKERA